jgi:hypothetical protein
MFEIVLFGLVLLILYIVVTGKHNENNINIEGFTVGDGDVYCNVSFAQSDEELDEINDMIDDIYHENFRDDDYAVNRTRGPMDRTDEEVTPWYHVANRLVTDDDIDTLDIIDTDSHEFKKKNKKNRLVIHEDFTMDADNVHNNGDGVRCVSECDNSIKYAHPDDMTNTYKDKGVYNDIIMGECKLDKKSQEIKEFLRDKVLNGYLDCECVTDATKSEATRDEIDRYREQQLRFRDKIYGTSNDAFDPVDKMNELTMTGITSNGQRVSDVSDAILRNQYNALHNEQNSKSLHDMGLVLNESLYSMDNIEYPDHQAFFKNALSNGNGPIDGKFYGTTTKGERHMLRDNWMYNNKPHANGGLEPGIRMNGNATFTLADDPDFMPEIMV